MIVRSFPSGHAGTWSAAAPSVAAGSGLHQQARAAEPPPAIAGAHVAAAREIDITRLYDAMPSSAMTVSPPMTALPAIRSVELEPSADLRRSHRGPQAARRGARQRWPLVAPAGPVRIAAGLALRDMRSKPR